MWIVLVGILIVTIVWVVRSASKSIAVGIREDAKFADAQDQALWQSDGFSPMVTFRLTRNQYGMAIDPDSDQFAIGIAGHPPRVYNFHQLIAVEVTRDGDTVTTSKGRIDAKGAAIATALVGPIGMALGAQTSSSSVSTDRIRKLGLKLFVSDPHRYSKSRFSLPVRRFRRTPHWWLQRSRKWMRGTEGCGPSLPAMQMPRRRTRRLDRLSTPRLHRYRSVFPYPRDGVGQHEPLGRSVRPREA